MHLQEFIFCVLAMVPLTTKYGRCAATRLDCAFASLSFTSSKKMGWTVQYKNGIRRLPCCPCRQVPTLLEAKASSSSSSSWGVADDWSSLSSEHPNSNARADSNAIFNTDLAAKAAREMEAEAQNDKLGSSDNTKVSPDDAFVHEVLDFIQLHGDVSEDPSSNVPLYDTQTSFDTYTKSVSFLDEAGKEISLLVRCNERPEDMLIREGRALPPLTEQEKYDVSQLVTLTVTEASSADGSNSEKHFAPTEFLNTAVSKIFHEHAIPVGAKRDDGTVVDGEAVLDKTAVAKWMTKSLGGETKEGKVGKHDKRVMAVISKYGTYGSGQLTESELQHLYLDAIKASWGVRKRTNDIPLKRAVGTMRQLKLEEPTIDSVWRDFKNHGIKSPREEERERMEQELRETYGAGTSLETRAKAQAYDTLFDECEILDWGDDQHYNLKSMHGERAADEDGNGRKRSKSSHELVELASDNATPKRIRDGEFVFIDEESCIGCTQCAQIAPSSFVMLDNGRARTFSQSNAPDVPIAVSACPVNCMHKVAFHELKEMELSRDNGDGRTDHRHMGPRGHTPLNVAGIDSDANHKSSWYHFLKQKCYMSKSCPQRGCYDCPAYSNPGDNPYFKERHRLAESVRAKDFISSGEADMYRNKEDL